MSQPPAQAPATPGPAQTQVQAGGQRFAVILKTYAWDPFVERQALRCQEATGSGDFYISIDETNGSVGPVPFQRVSRIDNATIIAAGFANRFERGSLLWWNADYPHYHFQEAHPDYDFYVFVEYDAVVRLDLAAVVAHMAAHQIDYVHLPIRMPTHDWFWTVYHGHTYPTAEIRGSLICVTAFSARALTMLAARRREMSQAATVPYWPLGELFVPTEIARANHRAMSIAEFGSVDRYHWFPPVMEDDLAGIDGAVVLHPVLDRDRMVPALLKSTGRFRSFVNPRSQTWRALRRFRFSDYGRRLPGAAMRRFRMSLREKIERRWLRMRLPVKRNLVEAPAARGQT